jgi:hypothetical protein
MNPSTCAEGATEKDDTHNHGLVLPIEKEYAILRYQSGEKRA